MRDSASATAARTGKEAETGSAAGAERGVLVSVYAGLALTVLSVLAVVVGNDALTDRLRELEAPYVGAQRASESGPVVATYLYVLGALGIGSWLVTGWAVRRHKRWLRPAATVVFLLALAIAVMNLQLTEYGRPVLPPLIAWAGIVPCIAGFATVVLLWRRKPSA